MARRTKEEALATRESLIDAAETVFRRDGVTRTSLAEIAAAAGVTRGAIYWHFRDKAELFDAMCERTMLPLDAALVHAAESVQADPLGTLRDIAVEALTALARDPRAQAVFEIVFHKCEMVGELALRREARDADRDRCHGRVGRLVEQAIAKGQLPPDTDVVLATRMLHAFVMGVMREWVSDPADYDLAAAAPQMIDAVLAGLRAQPPRRSDATVPPKPIVTCA